MSQLDIEIDSSRESSVMSIPEPPTPMLSTTCLLVVANKSVWLAIAISWRYKWYTDYYNPLPVYRLRRITTPWAQNTLKDSSREK